MNTNYDYQRIGERIANERKKIYVLRGKSNHYERENTDDGMMGNIIFSRKETKGYKKATQKDIINIARENYGFHIGGNALSDIENGNINDSNFSLNELIALATIYDCEIGYLLCEQDEPQRETIDGMKATGLSADAIRTLPTLDEGMRSLLSFCISSDDGDLMAALMGTFETYLNNACWYTGKHHTIERLDADSNCTKNIQNIFALFRESYYETHEKIPSCDKPSLPFRFFYPLGKY